MKFDIANHWNQSHLKHCDRQPSNYAIEKEKIFLSNSIVCDFGGSSGADSFYFIKQGHKVYLFDIADLAIKTAEEKAKILGLEDKIISKVIDFNKNKIPVDNNFFDVLYARLSLHYFSQKRTIEILKDIYRVLKKDGIAYIVVKSPEDKKEMDWLENQSQKIEEGIYNKNGLIQTRFTKEQYKSFLKKAKINNFEIKDYIEIFGDQKIYVKSGADKLLYIEIIIKK